MNVLDEKDRASRVDGLKWIAGGVVVAAPLLGLAGLTGGELSRLTRIHPVGSVICVGLILLATICGVVGLLAPRHAAKTGAAGGLAFVLGALGLLGLHADAVGIQERPTATLGIKRTETGQSAVVNVRAAGLRPEEYVFVLVEGHNSQRWLAANQPSFDDQRRDPLPDGVFSTQRLYKGRVGPSPGGTVDVSVELALASDLYELVVLQAVILEPGEKAREWELATGVKVEGTDDTQFACDSTSLDVSCASVLLSQPPRPKQG